MGIEDILRQLASGAYDGARRDIETNGVASGFYIHNGTPVQYREGPGTRFFDGKENVRTSGQRTERRYETDVERTEFMQKYGFNRDMFGAHPEVLEYSRDYYEQKRRPN